MILKINQDTLCETLSARGHNWKIKGPHPTGQNPSEIQISPSKLYSNEAFLISTLMMFNVDSNCVHPRFWIRALKVRHRHDVVRILRFIWKFTSWTKVLWRLVVSNVIPGDSWYVRKSPYVSWFIFKIIAFDDFRWISGVLMWSPLEESASHPLSSPGWVPQVRLGSRFVWV